MRAMIVIESKKTKLKYRHNVVGKTKEEIDTMIHKLVAISQKTIPDYKLIQTHYYAN